MQQDLQKKTKYANIWKYAIKCEGIAKYADYTKHKIYENMQIMQNMQDMERKKTKCAKCAIGENYAENAEYAKLNQTFQNKETWQTMLALGLKPWCPTKWRNALQ